jgi:hypothetical protein
VNGTSVVTSESKLIAQPPANLDVPASPPVSEQSETNVYAAYWQARSGFFTPVPKRTPAGIDLVMGSRQ